MIAVTALVLDEGSAADGERAARKLPGPFCPRHVSTCLWAKKSTVTDIPSFSIAV